MKVFILITIAMLILGTSHASGDKEQMISGIKNSCLSGAGNLINNDIRRYCDCYANGLARELNDKDIVNLKKELIKARSASDVRGIFDSNQKFQKVINECS